MSVNVLSCTVAVVEVYVLKHCFYLISVALLHIEVIETKTINTVQGVPSAHAKTQHGI